VREAASSSTAPRKAVPAPITAETLAKDKGKEKQMEPEQPPHIEVQQKEQQEKISEAPKYTEQQAQENVPPRQEKTVEASVLQTPQKEEKGKKRDREQETPLTTSTNQGEKRHRMNPLFEEEMHTEQSLGMGPPSREASASSFQQEQERTVGGEVSSSSQQRGAETGIKQ